MSQAWPLICQKLCAAPCARLTDTAPVHSKLKRSVSAAARSGSATGLAGKAGGQSPAGSPLATLFSVARRSGPLRSDSSVPASGTRRASSMRIPGPSQYSWPSGCGATGLPSSA
ncbi:hypothetical protein D3C81_1487050 [compost metagenome]